VNALEVLLAPF